MTIYIAGKMNGIKDYNFPAFYAKEEELKAKGWKVLNPAKIGILPEYDMYWPINQAMIDGSDAIYMLTSWIDSPGSNREHDYAKETGLKIYYEAKSFFRPHEEVPTIL